jgi:hypothetical protein
MGIAGAQESFAGGFGFGLSASTRKETSQTPIPTATKTINAQRSECMAASSLSGCDPYLSFAPG